MRSFLMVSLAVAVVASVASAGFYTADVTLGIYNNSGANINKSAAGTARIGKDDGDGRMAMFWTVDQQAAIAAEIAAIEGAGQTAVVKLEITGAYTDAPTHEFTFQSFKTASTPSFTKACWEAADFNVLGAPIKWQYSDGTAVPNADPTDYTSRLSTGFYALNEVQVNSNKIIGAVAGSPTALFGMAAELDAATLAHFLSDATAGNLAFISSGWVNDQAYMPAQWGGIATPQIAVYAVPEPATLALLAFGGLAAIRRRK